LIHMFLFRKYTMNSSVHDLNGALGPAAMGSNFRVFPLCNPARYSTQQMLLLTMLSTLQLMLQMLPRLPTPLTLPMLPMLPTLLMGTHHLTLQLEPLEKLEVVRAIAVRPSRSRTSAA